MSLLRMTPQALSRSRFALSPLAESVAAVMTLSRPCTDPWLSRWHAEHQPQFNDWLHADPFARGFVALLTTSKWLPSPVVVPPTGGMRTRLIDELERVSSFDDQTVRDELAESVRHSSMSHTLDWVEGRHLAARISDLISLVWARHVDPDWRRRRATLERDVMYRAGLLAAYGWPAALDRMSRHSAWEGADAIRFSSHAYAERRVSDEGMQFVPVTLARGTWLCEWRPAEYALIYPARGVADRGPEPTNSGVDRLLGPGRAQILRELQRPATNSELAFELGLSLGTVGGHIAVLRNAGMITGSRVGRRVAYCRTATADLLLNVQAEADDSARTVDARGTRSSGRRYPIR